MWRVLLALVLLTQVAVGCGGEEEPEPTPPLTKAEYIARADQECKAEEFLFLAVSPTAETRDDVAQQFRDLADAKQDVLESLQALTPPEANRKLLDRWLFARKQQIDIWRDDASEAASDDDRPRLRSVAVQIRMLRQQEFSLAGQYGMRECAEPPDEGNKGKGGEKL